MIVVRAVVVRSGLGTIRKIIRFFGDSTFVIDRVIGSRRIRPARVSVGVGDYLDVC